MFFTAIGRYSSMTYCTRVQLLIVLACLPILSYVRGSIVFDSNDEKLIIVNPFDVYDDFSGPVGSCNDSGCFTDLPINPCICSDERHCLCTRLEDAFLHVEDNTVIAINGTIQEFITGNVLYNFTNISVIGYGEIITINCQARGSIEFKDCNNVIIENITWKSCGHNDDLRYRSGSSTISYGLYFLDSFSQIYFYGLHFSICTNVTLRYCTFEASMVKIYDASGVVCIDQVHFLSTDAYDLPDVLPQATGLIINQTRVHRGTDVMVKVMNSFFSQTECLVLCTNLLLFYILVDDPDSTIQVLVSQTNFSSASYDPGWAAENGMVWMRILSSQDAYIEFNEVKFLSNNFKPELLPILSGMPYNFTAILHVASDIFKTSRHGHSTRVKIESCTFLNNFANRVAFFEGDIYLDVINTQFYNNMAESILFVTYTYLDLFVATTLKLEQSIFSNNTGGRLMLLTGEVILVNISGLQITNNILSSDNDELILFNGYKNIIADINNVKYDLNHIVGEGSGFRFTSANIDIMLSVAFVILNTRTCFPSDFEDVLPHLNLVRYSGTHYRLANCTEMNFHWFSITNSSFNNNIGGGHGAVLYFNYANDGLINGTMNTCTCKNNSDYKSLIYAFSRSPIDVDLIVKDSIFAQNAEMVLYVVNHTLQFCNDINMTIFDGNVAQNGPAVYLEMNSKVLFTNNSAVYFSNNIAGRFGGAIYYDITQSSDTCYRNVSALTVENNASVVFKNNQARAAGDSIFFSISQFCNGTLQYDDQSLNFGQSTVVMSPNRLRLYHPAQLVNSSDLSTYYINDIMLGQDIIIPACTVDLNEMPLWSVQFTLRLVGKNEQKYFIQGSDTISVDCRTSQGINNLAVTGSPPHDDIISTITIQLNSFYDSTFDWKPITVNLNVQLSSCHVGFYYSSDVERCVCYTTDDIVTCSGGNSAIRNGYWFGTINDQPTVTVCPENYCSFDNCEATTGTCDLYPLRDDQCRAHRSGAACGSCEEGYTLSFDSVECIEIDRCTVGQTVVVVTMSFVYWIIIIVIVFGMMYFKIEIGYLYGITFYYSIIDILLQETLPINDGQYQFVTILTSAAKLLPRFLGRLCFVEGMSGIDQQFIHYLHPLAVLLIILLLSFSARLSPRLSLFLSRVVIHGICLLLLLAYTSIASTTLLLVRSIRFIDIDKVYSYLSPDIEYFHGRHLFYVLVAILTGLVIVIGLPLLLSIEPFINSKINFIKIKPLLDQFQGCYKDNFRYFASYYMIFRLIVLTVIVIDATNIFVTLYLLLVSCSLMMFIHLAIRPYVSNVLNLFDSFMILNMILVISLLIIETYRGFQSSATLAITIVLIIMPLLAFLIMVVYLHIASIKKLAGYFISAIRKPVKSADNDNWHNEDIEMHDVVEHLRDKATTTTM